MSISQQRAWIRAEREASGDRLKLLQKSRAELVALLERARADISILLAGQPSDYQQWRLPELNKEIERVLGEVGSRAGDVMSAASNAAWNGGIDAIDKPLSAAGIRISLTHLSSDQLMAMRTFMVDRIKDVSAVAASRIKTELGLTMIGAQSIHDTINKVAGHLGEPSRSRATTIVRSELSRVWATASYERAQQSADSGIEMDKVWRRSGKIHSRLAHDLMDGTRVALDEAFVVNGHEMRYPHDPKAPASEVINCGCVCLYRPRAIFGTTADKRPYSTDELRLNPNKAQLASGQSLRAMGLASPISRTVKDAEDVSRALGVARVDYRASLAAANLANDALQALQTIGVALPDLVAVDRGAFAHFGMAEGAAEAMFAPSADKQLAFVFLDPAATYWSSPEAVVAAEYARGWWSTNHRLHALFHEFGHMAHFRAAPDSYLDLYGKNDFPADAVADIGRLVSDYALDGPLEFVAEVFAGLMAGRRYPDQVMTWYRKFGGLVP